MSTFLLITILKLPDREYFHCTTSSGNVECTHLLGRAWVSPTLAGFWYGHNIMYTNDYEKSRPFPYLVGTLVHVAKGNEHSLLTFLLFFIRSFVLQTITSELHLVSIFGCTVIHVMENKQVEITNAPYLVVWSFMSRRINKLRLLILHIWLYSHSCHED